MSPDERLGVPIDGMWDEDNEFVKGFPWPGSDESSESSAASLATRAGRSPSLWSFNMQSRMFLHPARMKSPYLFIVKQLHVNKI